MTPPNDAPSPTSVGDRIIEATLTLIARDGLGAVTMSRVADTAGVSRQTLYNHYPDVDAIVVEAIARHNRESIRLLESALQVVDGPVARLEQLVRHMVSIGAHAHHAPGLEHGLSPDAQASLRAYDAALDGCIRDALDEGRRAGVFRADLDLEVDTTLTRHLLTGLTQQAAAAPAQAATIAAVGARTLLAAVAAG